MRYVDTSNFRAPYDNVDFQGLGQYPTHIGQYPTHSNLYGRGRGPAIFNPNDVHQGQTVVAGMGILGSAGMGVLGAEAPPALPAECVFPFGGPPKPAISALQAAINVQLVQLGYLPIPVSGVWDAKTCGALEFVAASRSVLCGQGIDTIDLMQLKAACSSIDLDVCKERIRPTKDPNGTSAGARVFCGGGSEPPDTAPQQASMLPWVLGGGGVILALWLATRALATPKRTSRRTTRRAA